MEQHDTSFPISIWIGLLMVIYIGLTGGTIIDMIIGGLVVTIIGIIIGVLIKVYFYPKLDEKREDKKRHNKEIVYDVFKKFMDMRIKYTSGFNVLLQEVDNLRNEKKFYWALEHLKAYQNSWEGWKKLEEINKQLKIKWEKLEEFILNKIEIDLCDEYKDCLLFPLWVIVKDAILEDIKSINIEMKEHSGGRYLDVGLQGKPLNPIHLKERSMGKIKKFMTNLQKDNELNYKITEMQEIHKKLDDAINQFKSDLDEEDVVNEFRLKGKCKGCPRLIRLFGDC